MAPLKVHYSTHRRSRLQHRYCVITLKRYRQLQMKYLPKVPTWLLESDSNLRPFGRIASNLPLSNHAPELPHRFTSTKRSISQPLLSKSTSFTETTALKLRLPGH